MGDLIPDGHNPDEDDNYVEIRMRFVTPPDPIDGEFPLTAAKVETHVHHVPMPQYIDSLLLLAQQTMVDQMKENMFNENVPEDVRDAAASIMATQYLKQRIESGSFMQNKPFGDTDMRVPDDPSELFRDKD